MYLTIVPHRLALLPLEVFLLPFKIIIIEEFNLSRLETVFHTCCINFIPHYFPKPSYV